MLVVGDDEQASGTVTPRRRHGSGQGRESGAVPADTMAQELVREISERRSAAAREEG